jgi:DNA invertase Pin-like site-specific DNA recombinase
MVAAYLASNLGEVLGEYTEVETGKTLRKSMTRPELSKAIAHARSAGATLLIAKLDRLARNVAFTSALMESGLDFVCCDMPQADRFTLHIIAAVAEREGEMISQRIRDALGALKLRGKKLGSALPGHWDGLTKAGESRLSRREFGLRKARQAAGKVVAEDMAKRYDPIVPWVREMRESGMTLPAIVDALNVKGCMTTRGNKWNVATLHRMISRFLGMDFLGQLNSKLRPCIAAGSR